jgi:hypothetical protein
MTGVTAPATQPWNHEQIVAKALAVLRLEETDLDMAQVSFAESMATELLDDELDTTEPLASISSAVEGGAVHLTVEIYRRKDAPFGVLNAWSPDEIAVRVGSDVMRGVRSIVRHAKERFGLA